MVFGEASALLFALVGSASLAWGGVALSGAADVRAVLWIGVGMVALRLSSLASGVP